MRTRQQETQGGSAPDSRNSRVPPRPYRSLAGWAQPRNCSGAIYPLVPTMVVPMPRPPATAAACNGGFWVEPGL